MAGIGDLVKALTPVKAGDSVLTVASASRINAIQDIIKGLLRGDNLVAGVNMRKNAQSGIVVFTGTPAGTNRGGGGDKSPFHVSTAGDTSYPSYPVLKLYPGRVSSIVPTIDGTKLDHDPPPLLYTPTTDFSVYLKASFNFTVPDDEYRSYLNTVEVVTSEDVVDDLEDGKIIDGKITWEEDEDHPDMNVKGHFYLLVADVQADPGGVGVIYGPITQWLFDNYQTFVFTSDYALVFR